MSGWHWRKKNNTPHLFLLRMAVFFFLLLPIGSVSLHAQPTLKEVIEDTAKKSQEVTFDPDNEGEVPEDELNRGVPRTMVQGFFLAIRQRDFQRASQYLDLRNLPEAVQKIPGSELARALRIVLARTHWIDLDKLSLDPAGRRKDGLPPYRDRIGQIKGKSKTFDILLQKVPRGDGVAIWKFSNKTVAQVPEMYAVFAQTFWDEVLPPWFFEVRVLELYLGEWVGGISLILIAFLGAVSLTAPLYYWMRRQDGLILLTQLLDFFQTPFRLVLWMLIARQLVAIWQLSLVGQAVYQAKIGMFIIFTWFAMRAIDFSFVRLGFRMKKKGQPGWAVLLPTLGNVLKMVLALVVLIFWLDNIGVKVTTLVAGLGIGGLAVALAAQKSLENVFGAITLYVSHPVKVGDFCRFGESCGTIEEIGMRATKVRTHDSTIINVPNAEFSSMQIENFSLREHMWYHPKIRLRSSTTPDQIRYVLVEVRKMFYSHPKVLPSPARIRFEGFGEHSLDLQVFAFLDVTDPDNFTEVAEDLNLRIMDIITKSGTELALPAQTLYVQRGRDLDKTKLEETEKCVQGWRDNHELFLPSFPQEKIAELQGSLDYPPVGSPMAARG
ncbi:MAG: mechanosensitive ion channel family protein [Nitrospirales bacterium]|nr:mechanosensitive ion channel family protein [Nitrospirales bacterium]